jgi:23S rRNA (uracil1939-C5)-methyltransferase
MPSSCLIPFKISSLDSLGQGVSKLTDKITFISKTDIGDEGMAEIISQKKGVLFAKAVSFSHESSRKITPDCIHFEQCSGCHFLHLPYEDEIKSKANSLNHLFGRLPHPEIKILKSEERLHYRNRIQLHYNLKSKRLGFFEEKTHQILPVPNCQIPHPLVKEKMSWLYESENWIKLAPKNQPQGHVEIYLKDNEIQLSWNKAYAEGGFTQVFDKMNQSLKERLNSWVESLKISSILDIFAGGGNLSGDFSGVQRFCIDVYSPEAQLAHHFISQNLYHDDALKKISLKLKTNNFSPDLLILDPPRSGLKNLEEWAKQFSPQFMAYISCDPHTMVRDLRTLTSYEIKEVFLVDFFPSTYHFETMVFLERKS